MHAGIYRFLGYLENTNNIPPEMAREFIRLKYNSLGYILNTKQYIGLLSKFDDEKECRYYLEKNKFKHINDVLVYGARYGSMIIVNYAIEKGARDWNWGMCGAAKGGHMDIVEFFNEKLVDLR